MFLMWNLKKSINRIFIFQKALYLLVFFSVKKLTKFDYLFGELKAVKIWMLFNSGSNLFSWNNKFK
jgi:hypothetical protein